MIRTNSKKTILRKTILSISALAMMSVTAACKQEDDSSDGAAPGYVAGAQSLAEKQALEERKKQVLASYIGEYRYTDDSGSIPVRERVEICSDRLKVFSREYPFKFLTIKYPSEFDKRDFLKHDKITFWRWKSREAKYKFSNTAEDFEKVSAFLDSSSLVLCNESEHFYYVLPEPSDGSRNSVTRVDFTSINFKNLGIEDSSMGELTGTYIREEPVRLERYTPQQENPSGNGGDQQGSGVSESLTGTYSYMGASGYEKSGALTLTSDGTWSYSGEKSNIAASSGTYTVSGSKVTFFWNTNGYDVSESFTVTNSGSSSEWRSDSNGTSTFLSMVFNVMSLSITLGKS